MCKDSLLLIKSIGLPGLIEGDDLSPNEALRLLPLAELNKIPLLFLESLPKTKEHHILKTRFLQYRKRYEDTLDLVAITSKLLDELGILHTFFKTLRPFSYTPADVDVLFWSKEYFIKATRAFAKRGFKPLDRDLYGLTMSSPNYRVNLDLTTAITVSNFIYLDKRLLFDYVGEFEVEGSRIRSLQPPVDLVAIAAHSMYKEQMYTLSDYYTFALSSEYYKEALQIAESTHTKYSFKMALKLAYSITTTVFGLDNILANRLENLFHRIDMGKKVQADKHFEFPKKYAPDKILKGLLKKNIEDPISRKSLPRAIKSSFQPNFINKLLKHILRKGY